MNTHNYEERKQLVLQGKTREARRLSVWRCPVVGCRQSCQLLPGVPRLFIDLNFLEAILEQLATEASQPAPAPTQTGSSEAEEDLCYSEQDRAEMQRLAELLRRRLTQAHVIIEDDEPGRQPDDFEVIVID